MAINKEKIRILVVDDYKTMITIIRNLLMELGFCQIDEAFDGNTALNLLRENKYDLVISDWNMEPTNGLELLFKIRADDTLKHLSFIMVTADSKAENVIAAKNAGVDSFIIKPFNATTLRTKVAAIIGEF